MPHQPVQPAVGRWTAKQVGAHIAATCQFLARSRQQANRAMAHARYVDQLLHGTSQRSAAAELQEEGGWPARAAAARAHAARAREHARRAREELVGDQERAAAAQERLHELRRSLP